MQEKLEKNNFLLPFWCGLQCAIFSFLRGGRLTTFTQDEFNVTFEGDGEVGTAYNTGGNFDNWTLRVIPFTNFFLLRFFCEAFLQEQEPIGHFLYTLIFNVKQDQHSLASMMF